jgi:hypothetical protein
VEKSGLNELNNDMLNLFPNPSSGIVNIKSNELIEGIEVFDFYGKTLYQLNFVSSEAQIDMSSFAAGNYILQAKFATGTIQRKISIH